MNEYTYISESEYMAMSAFIPLDVFYSDNEVVMGNRMYRKLKTTTYQTIRGRYEAYKVKNDKLNRCAELNNRGVACEKSGDIFGAVEAYEENISGDCYPATHSFDRLCVIYRRVKDYKNEIRVLQKACKVFKLDKYRIRLEKAKELYSKSKKP